MELAQVAKDTMMVLSPTLPMLVAGGTEAAKEAGKSVGKAIPAAVKKIWEVLNSDIILRPPGFQEAIAEVEKTPEDVDALQMLELQVKKILKEDDGLVKKLVALLQDESLQQNQAGISQITQQTEGDQSPAVVAQGNLTMTFGNRK